MHHISLSKHVWESINKYGVIPTINTLTASLLKGKTPTPNECPKESGIL